MHGGVSRKTLQAPAHVDQILYLLIRLIELSQLRIDLQRPVNRDIKLIGDHFGKRIYIGIRQIHHSSHIPDHALRGKRTEGDDLHHLLRAVFAAHIIDDLLPSLKAEININIRHGYTLRI